MACHGLVFSLLAFTYFALCDAEVVSRKELATGKDVFTDESVRDLKDVRISQRFQSRVSAEISQLNPQSNHQGLGAWPIFDVEGADTMKDTRRGDGSIRPAVYYRDKRGAWSWWKPVQKTPGRQKGATKARNRWRPRGRSRDDDDDDDDDDDCSDSRSSEEEDGAKSTRRRNRRPRQVKRRGRGNSSHRGDDGRRRKRRPCRRHRGKGVPAVTTPVPTTTIVTVTSPEPPTTTQASETTAIVETTQILTRTVSQTSAPQTERQMSTLEATSPLEEEPTTTEATTTTAIKTLGIDPQPK